MPGHGAGGGVGGGGVAGAGAGAGAGGQIVQLSVPQQQHFQQQDQQQQQQTQQLIPANLLQDSQHGPRQITFLQPVSTCDTPSCKLGEKDANHVCSANYH